MHIPVIKFGILSLYSPMYSLIQILFSFFKVNLVKALVNTEYLSGFAASCYSNYTQELKISLLPVSKQNYHA